MTVIAVTGANGKLGSLVVQQLLAAKVPAKDIVAIVRNPDNAAPLKASGVQVRVASYDDRAAFVEALRGVNAVLLIASSEIGKRVPQHSNVISAAKETGVELLAYVSTVHPESPATLAPEHLATEEALKTGGVPYTVLRQGWYMETEGFARLVPAVLQSGKVLGAAGNGRISGVTRADIAAAAARVLTDRAGRAGKTYNLAGVQAYTLGDYAAEISRQSGKPAAYESLSESEFSKTLVGLGFPDFIGDFLANADGGLRGEFMYLDPAENALPELLGRQPTTMPEAVASVLKGLREA